MALFAGVIVLVAATGLFLAFVPVVSCPECAARSVDPSDEPAIFFPEAKETGGLAGPGPAPAAAMPPPPDCDLCRDRRRITPARKWAGTRGWEGKTVAARASRGFGKVDSTAMLDRTGIRLGSPVTRKIVEDARETLLRTGAFTDVRIDVFDHPATPGKVKVLTVVVESTP